MNLAEQFVKLQGDLAADKAVEEARLAKERTEFAKREADKIATDLEGYLRDRCNPWENGREVAYVIPSSIEKEVVEMLFEATGLRSFTRLDIMSLVLVIRNPNPAL